MPFLNTFELREPSHPPALWLVPRWWAFSRDDRYRVGYVHDRGAKCTQSNLRAAHPQRGEKSRQQPMSYQERGLSKRQYDLRQSVREQSPPLSQAPANPHSCPKETALGIPQICDTRPSEAVQALILTPKVITHGRNHKPGDPSQNCMQTTYTAHTDHESHLPTQQQARHLPIRQRKGQTEQRTHRISNLPRIARLLEHEPGCQAIKVDNLGPSFKSYVPVQVAFAHPPAATHQHKQESNNSSDSLCYEDDRTCVEGLTEQQRSLIQGLLAEPGNCHHLTCSKYENLINGPFLRKALSIPPVTEAHLLLKSDFMKDRMGSFDPRAHGLTSHTCAHLTSFPSDQVPDLDYQGIDCDTHSPVKISQCHLDGIPHVDHPKSPLQRQSLAHDQAHKFSFHTAHHPHVGDHQHQHPAYEQHVCPHRTNDDVFQHNRHHQSAQHKLLSPQSPNSRTTHQGFTKFQQTQDLYPENRSHYPSHECNNPPSPFSMPLPPRHHVMNEDQLADIRCDHQDLNGHQKFHGADNSPAVDFTYRQTYRPESPNKPHALGQDGCGQLGCSSCGFNPGRRTSYVRTRGEERDTRL